MIVVFGINREAEWISVSHVHSPIPVLPVGDEEYRGHGRHVLFDVCLYWFCKHVIACVLVTTDVKSKRYHNIFVFRSCCDVGKRFAYIRIYRQRQLVQTRVHLFEKVAHVWGHEPGCRYLKIEVGCVHNARVGP